MELKKFLLALVLVLAIPLTTLGDDARDAARSEMVSALGIVPPFIEMLPEGTQAGAWAFMKGSSGNPDGEIPPKYRELIALGVAAQIPCAYCAYAHTKFAIANGATDVEIREAIAYGAEVRLWSTVLNGSQYDLETWKSEIDSILEYFSAATKSN